MGFTPLLTTTDWNEEWMGLQAARHHADDAAVWDAKSKTFPVKHGSQTPYVSRFLELADIRPGETVFDMGCGTGALATPLALGGHRVIACDFSGGMLSAMLEDQAALGVEGVEAHQLSWDDDWQVAGFEDRSVDVALASRSIATYDLQESLGKLTRVARRRACITLPCGSNPKIDERLLAGAGFKRAIGSDFLYAFNILASQGISPEVAYIPSSRFELFDSYEAALEGYSKIVRNAVEGYASPDEISAIPERLKLWLKENLVSDERGYHLKEERQVIWAFIAWSTETAPARDKITPQTTQQTK